MATAVFFHAHPDDESMLTGGVMAKAAADGHRVVLCVATNGELGEAPDDLAPGERLADRRAAELACSARVLGVARVVRLGYHDSGMEGWPQNEDDHAFCRVPVEEAASRLADVLREEAADVLVVYDRQGMYGHPDHVQVHRVGVRAAELAATPVVYEATVNRDLILQWAAEAAAAGEPLEGFDEFTDDTPFGLREHELTTAVDVRDFLEHKRSSLSCHASQVSDVTFLLGFPPDRFVQAFGTEWFVRRGAPPGLHERALAGLDGPGAP